MAKLLLPLALVLITSLFANAQPAAGNLRLERIIYHSTHCNGTCPEVYMEIDSNRNVFIWREFWKKKGEIDKRGTGNFKGKLDPKSYTRLISTLIACDYKNLKFPKADCCDAPMTTIIIYAEGSRTYLKSMFPPQQAAQLISFLYNLATKLKLPSTLENYEMEQ